MRVLQHPTTYSSVTMFKGKYAGKNVAEQNKKIIILGESHYGDVTTTKSVMFVENRLPRN